MHNVYYKYIRSFSSDQQLVTKVKVIIGEYSELPMPEVRLDILPCLSPILRYPYPQVADSFPFFERQFLLFQLYIVWKCCRHFQVFLRTPYGHTKINFSFLSSRTPLYSWLHNLAIIDNIFQVLCSFIKSVSKKYENSQLCRFGYFFVVFVRVNMVTLSLVLISEWKPA